MGACLTLGPESMCDQRLHTITPRVIVGYDPGLRRSGNRVDLVRPAEPKIAVGYPERSAEKASPFESGPGDRRSTRSARQPPRSAKGRPARTIFDPDQRPVAHLF